MADAPKTVAKRKSFIRTEKPIYAVLTYTDESGTEVKLHKAGLKIALERDPAKIMEAMEAGMGNSIFVKLDMPKSAPRTAAAETPAA